MTHFTATNEKTNILLVDDKPANLLVLEEILSNPEYNLVKAQSGRKALQFLLKDEFALVLLDVQMPEINGFETARLIRGYDRTRGLPIIFLTAESLSTENVAEGYAQNAVDYILKPFNPEILKTKVSVFVELYRKTEQLREQTNLLNQKIEDEKIAKKELIQLADNLARSNLELAQFAHVVSHDLQEPLRMVSSFVQLLAKRYKGRLDKDADEFINYAVDGVHRMKGMLLSILDYSRVGSRGKKFEWVDCNSIIDQVLADLRLLIEESGAEVTYGSFPNILADKTQLRQAFQNLIANAIKFRNADIPCRINVSCSLARDINPKPEIVDGFDPETCLFCVRDNGIGFEQQHAERIFQIFAQLHDKEKYPGTGIGLAICKKIIERHGGRIWVESEPGKGTAFYFTLAREIK